MASILSGHTGTMPVVPSGRIAAGLVSRHERERRICGSTIMPGCESSLARIRFARSLDQKPLK
jgi:hypothetical protein